MRPANPYEIARIKLDLAAREQRGFILVVDRGDPTDYVVHTFDFWLLLSQFLRERQVNLVNRARNSGK